MISDFSRQSELFDVESFNERVNIIGVGATGSWLATFLSKLGIKNIHIWDFDDIEEHNIPNQAFDMKYIGYNKAVAMQEAIIRNTGNVIQASSERYTSERLQGYVFLMVDSMAERKRIWDYAVKYKSAIKLLIEPRMGLELGRIYTVEPTNSTHIEKYETNFYDDSNAEVSACGTSMTIVTTAATIAALCAKQLINHANSEELFNEMIVDLKFNQFVNTRW